MLLNVAASFPNALFVKDFQCDKDCDRGLGSLGRVLGGNQKINKIRIIFIQLFWQIKRWQKPTSELKSLNNVDIWRP